MGRSREELKAYVTEKSIQDPLDTRKMGLYLSSKHNGGLFLSIDAITTGSHWLITAGNDEPLPVIDA